jgi:hypothetical protein
MEWALQQFVTNHHQTACWNAVQRNMNRRLQYSHFLIGEEECHIYQNGLTSFWQSWNEPPLEKKGYSFITFQKSLRKLMKFCAWFLAWCNVWVFLGQESLSCEDYNCVWVFSQARTCPRLPALFSWCQHATPSPLPNNVISPMGKNSYV